MTVVYPALIVQTSTLIATITTSFPIMAFTTTYFPSASVINYSVTPPRLDFLSGWLIFFCLRLLSLSWNVRSEDPLQMIQRISNWKHSPAPQIGLGDSQWNYFQKSSALFFVFDEADLQYQSSLGSKWNARTFEPLFNQHSLSISATLMAYPICLVPSTFSLQSLP